MITIAISTDAGGRTGLSPAYSPDVTEAEVIAVWMFCRNGAIEKHVKVTLEGICAQAGLKRVKLLSE